MTKDWNVQCENLIYSSPDRMEIYFIGSIYLLYAYIRKIEGVEPTTTIFLGGTACICVLAPDAYAVTGGKGAWKPTKTS